MPRQSDSIQAFGNDAALGSPNVVLLAFNVGVEADGSDPCTRRGREPLALAALKLQWLRLDEQYRCYCRLSLFTRPHANPHAT